MWVRGHQGEEGSEKADSRAKEEVEMGWRLNKPDVATPAGIKQAHPLHSKAPKHMRWSMKAIQGLVFMVMDKGLQHHWLWEIGKTDEPQYVCDGWTPQNAAHLQRCL